MALVADDLIPILTRFHREIIFPDVQHTVGSAVGALEQRLNVHFDAIYQRFDRLETEYHMLVAGPEPSRGSSGRRREAPG